VIVYCWKCGIVIDSGMVRRVHVKHKGYYYYHEECSNKGILIPYKKVKYLIEQCKCAMNKHDRKNYALREGGREMSARIAKSSIGGLKSKNQ